MTEMANEIERVTGKHAAWADRTSRGLNDRRTAFTNFDDCLLVPLDPETRGQLEAGAGNELMRMTSMRSSSALAVNVFLPWKGNLEPLAVALGFPGDYSAMGFEQKFPTGVSNRHPHLDVVLYGKPRPVAVEAKFLEIYDPPKKQEIANSYRLKPELWEGLANLRTLADEVVARPDVYERLGVAQLVKHSLGLSRKYGPRGFELVYIWYEVPGQIAQTHLEEIERFRKRIMGDISFTALTYQELLADLVTLAEPITGYLDHLMGRYFDGTPK